MRRGLPSVILWLTFLANTALAQTADGDPFPSLDLRGFHPSPDPSATFLLEAATTPGHGNWNIGFYTSYALKPLVIGTRDGDETNVIEHQLSVDYVANIGITDRLALGATIPTVVYQKGGDAEELLPGSTTLPSAAFGDAIFTAKGTIISPGDLGGFGLAAVGRLYTPTGDRESYVSDASVRGELRLLGELQLLALAVRATAGGRFRGAEQTLVDDGTDDYRFGHDLPWGASLTVRPQAFGIDSKGRWRWTLESRGAIGLTPDFASGPQSPALFGASARYVVDEVSAFLGVELPLNNGVGNPTVRPVLGIGWAPRFEDADDDGIGDDDDECPELAEDADGFEDRDGCPDFDNDEDGVPDAEDKCPGELEDADEYQDGDGCPDPDNDVDGVLDVDDACPLVAASAANAKPGCPVVDSDGDGIFDDRDQCIDQPEDADQFRDEDGCPDPDNDADGVPDDEDQCRNEAGEPHPGTPYDGCPNPDRDGDTFLDDDACPDAAEVFNGTADGDGCPDDGAGQALVRVVERNGHPDLALRRPLNFQGEELDAGSIAVLRAISQMLMAHPDWIIGVGVRPADATPEATQEALNRSFTVALGLRRLSLRDSAAESLGWNAVRDDPDAGKSGIGLVLFAPREAARTPAEGSQ